MPWLNPYQLKIVLKRQLQMVKHSHFLFRFCEISLQNEDID